MPEKLKPIVPTKHKTTKQVAKALLKLYRDPRRHHQGNYFRGVSGKDVRPENAVACCLAGGIDLYTASDEVSEQVIDEIDFIAEECFGKTLVDVNDLEGLDAVKVVLRKAAQ